MALWFTLILFAATLVLSEVFKPRPDIENARPAGLGDFQFPTATAGRAIPLIWGTVLLKGPNVVWYGDLIQEAITEKVKTGLFSSKRTITGYRYSVGIQMVFCRGREAATAGDVEFLRMYIGEEEFANADGTNPLGSGISSGTVAFDNPEFLGGEENGRGGIVGPVTFRPGSLDQGIPDYNRIHQKLTADKTPRYPGDAFALAERVYVGTSEQIDPWWVEARRLPDPLSLGSANGVNGGMDCNPMSVIAEVLTNIDWGFSEPLSRLNQAGMSAIATTLFNEGNGFSYVLDRKVDAADLMRDVERQVDGVLFLNRRTGQWDFQLSREGDASVLSLDDSNVIEVGDFTRGSFQDTSNEVLTRFQNRDRNYDDDWGRDQDLGNIQQRGGVIVTEEVSYTGVKDGDLGQALASRDLVTFSYPLARATLVVNREAWDLNPVDVVQWTSAALGITNLRLRVSRVDFGDMLDGKITLNLVEDIFSLGSNAFAPPDGGSWVPPGSNLLAYNADTPSQALIIEAPRAFVDRDPDLPGQHPRVWFGARAKGDGAISYDLVESDGTVQGGAGAFFAMGQLSAALPASGGSTLTFEIVAGASTLSEIRSQLESVSAGDVGEQLDQIVLIGDEIVGIQDITDLGSSIRVDVGYRGLLDTVPQSHAINAPVYLIFVGGSLSDEIFPGGSRTIVTQGLRGVELAVAQGFTASLSVDQRYLKPYPVARLRWNLSDFPASIDFGQALSGIPFDTRGVRLNFVRRDFRFGDEVAKHVDESVLPADFPAANTTEYRVSLDPDLGLTQAGTWSSANDDEIAFSRAELIWLINNNPASIDWSFDVRHTVDGVVREGNSIVHTTALTGSQAGKAYLGRMDNGTVESFTAPDDGSYGFDIGADLLNGGVVEAQINGGGYSTVVSAGGSSGTLSGVTSGDTIDVRHTGVDGDAVFALLLIDPPTSAGFVAPMRI